MIVAGEQLSSIGRFDPHRVGLKTGQVSDQIAKFARGKVLDQFLRHRRLASLLINDRISKDRFARTVGPNQTDRLVILPLHDPGVDLARIIRNDDRFEPFGDPRIGETDRFQKVSAIAKLADRGEVRADLAPLLADTVATDARELRPFEHLGTFTRVTAAERKPPSPQRVFRLKFLLMSPQQLRPGQSLSGACRFEQVERGVGDVTGAGRGAFGAADRQA